MLENSLQGLIRSVAQPGSAPVWGTGGRGFKSRRSDQFLFNYQIDKLSPFYNNYIKSGYGINTESNSITLRLTRSYFFKNFRTK